MCGRYVIKSEAKALAEAFDCEIGVQLEPRYNVAPTQPVPIIRVRKDTGARRLSLVRWGLIPHWADDPTIGNRLINARSETIATKPAFRDAFRYRRCLIPADAFYEWKKINSRRKQPYAIHRADGKPFAFAGLWEHWQDADGNEMDTCTILTTEAHGPVAELHERMPVILDASAHTAWLDPRHQDRDALQALLHRELAEPLAQYPVGLMVNSPRHDSPACMEPVEGG